MWQLAKKNNNKSGNKLGDKPAKSIGNFLTKLQLKASTQLTAVIWPAATVLGQIQHHLDDYDTGVSVRHFLVKCGNEMLQLDFLDNRLSFKSAIQLNSNNNNKKQFKW